MIDATEETEAIEAIEGRAAAARAHPTFAIAAADAARTKARPTPTAPAEAIGNESAKIVTRDAMAGATPAAKVAVTEAATVETEAVTENGIVTAADAAKTTEEEVLIETLGDTMKGGAVGGGAAASGIATMAGAEAALAVVVAATPATCSPSTSGGAARPRRPRSASRRQI